jgi:hypothetical protein
MPAHSRKATFLVYRAGPRVRRQGRLLSRQRLDQGMMKRLTHDDPGYRRETKSGQHIRQDPLIDDLHRTTAGCRDTTSAVYPTQ